MENALKQELKFLKGVGPKKAELLQKEMGFVHIEDLLNHFPYKYIDRSKIFRIAEVSHTNTHVQIKGRIQSFKLEGSKYRQRLVAKFQDSSGEIELIWFQGVKWVQKNLQVGVEYIAFGRPSIFNRKISIPHPEMESASQAGNKEVQPLSPQYNTSEKLKTNYLNSKGVQKLVENAFKLPNLSIPETLPPYLLEKYKFMPLPIAYRNVHFPKSAADLQKAQSRLKFEELLFIQLNILKSKFGHRKNYKGFVFEKVGNFFNSFYKNKLPFELTGAQKRVIKEIRRDLGSGQHMNRMLQGDVGSGKTLVALMSMLIAIDNSFQACLMAPTEILAQQHYHSISKMLEGIGVNVLLLTGSTKKKERELIHEELRSGRLHILIGTHALIEDPVKFSNLGLVIIDEQHRFGVAQRAKLWKKNEHPPHVLVMTATPIPRTLAMTLYGDLDVSIIDELPPGRKPIQTYHYRDSNRMAMYGFIRKQIAEGRQVYVVYPLIKESESLDYKDLEDGYAGISEAFPPPQYSVVCVHGKMKPQDKETGMAIFKEGKANIMVATTVIEVGVDVPNASVMVIESAERFGLSQLHQLRGRVGRGADQSYCILMTSYKLSNDGRQRIDTMVRTNDGFEIAEADLKLRGPGDIEGTQQSGVPFDLKMANLARDGQMLQFARNVAEEILEKDPELRGPENKRLLLKLKNMRSTKFDWSAIS